MQQKGEFPHRKGGDFFSPKHHNNVHFVATTLQAVLETVALFLKRERERERSTAEIESEFHSLRCIRRTGTQQHSAKGIARHSSSFRIEWFTFYNILRYERWMLVMKGFMLLQVHCFLVIMAYRGGAGANRLRVQ